MYFLLLAPRMYTYVERTKVENYIYIIAQNSAICDEKADFRDETAIFPDKMQRQNHKTEQHAHNVAPSPPCEK